MSNYYLAVDMGASSGRLILGRLNNGRFELEEMHRFENGMVERDGELCWDYHRLFHEIREGLKKCVSAGKVPASMGIDTWGVDFALVKEDGTIVGNTVGYRSDRTNGMDDEVAKIIPLDELYENTGIQKAIYNTIYQLMAVKQNSPSDLEQADRLLLVPDYFNYLLTGNMYNEYTHATTTQLIEPHKKNWNLELIERLGYPTKLFRDVVTSGTLIGRLKKDIVDYIGADLEVVAVPSHDTASAVLAVPAWDDDFIFLSSGTWSLIGVESMEPDCSQKSMEYNFTNEGGYEYRYRYIKNIMGLWLIQSIRHELNDQYSFSQIVKLAEESKDFPSRIDVNDECFLAPKSMIEAIKDYCRKTGQRVPESVGELATVVYTSLAECYAKSIKEIEELKGRVYGRLHIVGGGSNAEYLNQLTAKATRKAVYAGPSEGTAIGNIMAQMLRAKEVKNLVEARKIIFESFEVKKVEI